MKDIRNGPQGGSWRPYVALSLTLSFPDRLKLEREIYLPFNDFLINCIFAVAVNFGLCVLRLLGNDSLPLCHYKSQEM